jgi:hypothetical protein
MLKRFFLDSKEIPVPIPILTVREAINWIGKSFVKEGMALTSVVVDGDQLIDCLADDKALSKTLNAASTFTVKIDSPKSLSIQTLDAIRDLAYVVQRLMREMGVEVWQYAEAGKQAHVDKLKEIGSDIRMILDLIDHLNGMADYTHEDLAAVNGLAHLLRRCVSQYEDFVRGEKWKDVANILVNRFESYLKEMVSESEKLQINIITLDFPDDALRQQITNTVK